MPFSLFLCAIDDEEDYEDFGWGDDEQEDDNEEESRAFSRPTSVTPRSDASPSSSAQPSPTRPAGGALGAMLPSSPLLSPPEAVASGRWGDGSAVDPAIAGRVGTGRPPDSGVSTLASTAAAEEIARLTEALRVCEAERASLVQAARLSGGSNIGGGLSDVGSVEELVRERDAAAAEVGNNFIRLYGTRRGGFACATSGIWCTAC